MLLRFMDLENQVVHERRQDLGYVPEIIEWGGRIYVRTYEGPTTDDGYKVVYHEEHWHHLD